MQIETIATQNNYDIIGEWCGYVVYRIPIIDMLPVKSVLTCRKLSSYSDMVMKFLMEDVIDVPMLGFVATDGCIRIKHGILYYWIAKETRQLSHLSVIFPLGPETTDSLVPEQLNILNIPANNWL